MPLCWPLIALLLQAPDGGCDVGVKGQCADDHFCEGRFEPRDDGSTACSSRGMCVPLPTPAALEFALPYPANETAYCAKGPLGSPPDTHSSCNTAARFALDLASSAFDPPHLVLASAAGTAFVWGGCSTSDLTHQDHFDGCNDGWGNYVRVQHDGGLYTQYAHLSGLLVNSGQKVERGAVLGIEGNTGGAGAKHIHFSVHRGDALNGGPSVPFTALLTSRGPVSSSTARCGNWRTSSTPVAETALTSTNQRLPSPSTFYFRALEQSTLVDAECPKGYQHLAPAACFAAPTGTAEPKGLIAYFHGMLPAALKLSDAPEFEVVRLAAVSKGYGVLALLGEPGLCTWSLEVRAYRCWANGKDQLPAMGRTLERLNQALQLVREKHRGLSSPPSLWGFSNGGFFVSLVASDSRYPSPAMVVAHGGLVQGQAFAAPGRAPVLLLGAERDSIQLPKMRALSAELERAGWSAQLLVRPGAHALTPEDAQAAVDFFERMRRRP